MAIRISGTTGIDMGNTSVSNASQVEVQEEQVSPFSGFKNYIINGKKVVNQRGLTSTNNSYNQDRWYKAGNNWFQGIEGANNLISGKTYTLSWVGGATASYYVGNVTSSTINSQTFIPITNGGSFTLTISAGQNLWIKFASDSTGSTFNFVQLEEGSVASPFEQRPIGLELSLCQRYYQKTFAYDVVPANGASVNSINDSSNGIVSICPHRSSLDGASKITILFPVEMRVSPTILKYGNSDGNWKILSADYNAFNPSIFVTPGTKGLNILNEAVSDNYLPIAFGHYTAYAEL